MKFYIRNQSNETLNNICILYQNGYSAPYLSKQYKCSIPIIYKILKFNNIKSRNKYEMNKSFTLNDKFFNKIDSHEKAQILGMYGADGCIQSKTKLSLGLKGEDKPYLEWIKNQLNFTGNLLFVKSRDNRNWGFGIKKDSYKLSIYSLAIINDLNKLGLFSRKSLTLDFPSKESVSDEFINSYVLGYFEGDGSISINKKSGNATIDICATLNFCKSLIKLIKEKLNINGRIYQYKNGKIYHFLIGGNHQVLRFLDWIYQDSTFRMDRKYQKYLQLKNKYKDFFNKFSNDRVSNINSKLTTSDVVKIKNMIHLKFYQSQIAKEFNVSQKTISKIKNNEMWKNISILA